jgi:hypothetical protein
MLKMSRIVGDAMGEELRWSKKRQPDATSITKDESVNIAPLAMSRVKPKDESSTKESRAREEWTAYGERLTF